MEICQNAKIPSQMPSEGFSPKNAFGLCEAMSLAIVLFPINQVLIRLIRQCWFAPVVLRSALPIELIDLYNLTRSRL